MVTPIYAGLLALLFVVLSARVIQMRVKAGVSLGTGDNRDLLRRQRVHGNFAEYVPFGLLLILLMELRGLPDWSLHALGVLLVSSRVLYMIALRGPKEVNKVRVAAMMCTFAVLVFGALGCLVPLGAAS